MSKRMQITRTKMRTGPADVCVAPLAALLPAAVLGVPPETALPAPGCDGGVDPVGRAGSALLALGWAVLPHAALAHLRAGRSFGTGGVVMGTSGGLDVVGGGFKAGGIVGGGCALARDERGITAKFG